MYYRDSKRIVKILSVAAFVLYMAVLLRLTVLRDNLFDGIPPSQRRINLRLWETYDWFLRTGQVIQFRYLLAGNFVCLAPLGFGCGFFRKGSSVLFAFFVCLLATLSIELFQLAFDIGYFELDDMVLNTLGGIFGYASHLLLCRVLKK